MSEVLKCQSCGGSNQLPEGKDSMYCAYCGTALSLFKESNKVIVEVKKPKIQRATIDEYGCLSFKNRNIDTVDEVVELYSDEELHRIYKLDLSGNKIKSLKGISSFAPREFNVSNNDIVIIDEIPSNNNKNEIFNTVHKVLLDFSYNSNLLKISDKVLNKINNSNYSKLTFNLTGCEKFDFNSLNINKSVVNEFFIITSKSIQIQDKLKLKGYFEINGDYNYPNSAVYSLNSLGVDPKIVDLIKGGQKLAAVKYYMEKSGIGLKEAKEYIDSLKLDSNSSPKSGSCFIATAAMGSYDHPLVLELRDFRDNWILKQSWGFSFVKWYYYYGSKAAKIIEKSYILKKISYLLIVSPMYFLLI